MICLSIFILQYLLFIHYSQSYDLSIAYKSIKSINRVNSCIYSTSQPTTSTTTSTITSTTASPTTSPAPKAEYMLRSRGPAASGGSGNRGGRQSQSQPPAHLLNGLIKSDRLRVIAASDDDDEDKDIMLGIMSSTEALAEADKRGLDLVMINDKGDPPVCRIIDYGKFKYSIEKKKKENLKKQSASRSEIKEVKMSYKIDTHDFDVRLRSVQRFINDGDRVKIIVQFKGREMQHKELGKDLLMKIYKPIEDLVVIESPPKEEGRAIAMLLGPKKDK